MIKKLLLLGVSRQLDSHLKKKIKVYQQLEDTCRDEKKWVYQYQTTRGFLIYEKT